ncbi:MAG: fasciclin domain-containing protein [Rhodothermales bacterium]|nr:fasciclin domain-containing protein [Rhodothermales bacterium]MBO6780404.1 fasciclin domain-containing protein [Rhodothermales bacterium]
MKLRFFPSLLVAMAVMFTAAFTPATTTDKDIVEVAVDAGQFNTLAAALTAAGLVDTLKGDGPFTVFAPTDEAFAKLPAGTVEDLLKPENKDKLVSILTYHVVPGKIMSGDLLSTTSAKTVNGASAAIGLRVGDANVVAADIAASNGVIHVIDTVLIP